MDPQPLGSCVARDLETAPSASRFDVSAEGQGRFHRHPSSAAGVPLADRRAMAGGARALSCASQRGRQPRCAPSRCEPRRASGTGRALARGPRRGGAGRCRWPGRGPRSAAGHADVGRGGAGGFADHEVGGGDGLTLGAVDGSGVGEFDVLADVRRGQHPVTRLAVRVEGAVVVDAGDCPAVAVDDAEVAAVAAGGDPVTDPLPVIRLPSRTDVQRSRTSFPYRMHRTSILRGE